MINTDLVVRRRIMHGRELWWIGRGKGKDFVFYADVYAPTGYGFKSKAKAEKIAKEIEERLRSEISIGITNSEQWQPEPMPKPTHA